MAQVNIVTSLLTSHLESVYHGKAWHGPTLRGSLRGLTAAQATTVHTQAGRTIADIALHCAYWKYAVRRKFAVLERGAFPYPGSNWFRLPSPLTEAEWKLILQVLDEQHRELVKATTSFDAARWARRAPDSKYTYQELVMGAAAHDVFHAGQVRLLKPKRGRGSPW